MELKKLSKELQNPFNTVAFGNLEIYIRAKNWFFNTTDSLKFSVWGIVTNKIQNIK